MPHVGMFQPMSMREPDTIDAVIRRNGFIGLFRHAPHVHRNLLERQHVHDALDELILDVEVQSEVSRTMDDMLDRVQGMNGIIPDTMFYNMGREMARN